MRLQPDKSASPGYTWMAPSDTRRLTIEPGINHARAIQIYLDRRSNKTDPQTIPGADMPQVSATGRNHPVDRARELVRLELLVAAGIVVENLDLEPLIRRVAPVRRPEQNP